MSLFKKTSSQEQQYQKVDWKSQHQGQHPLLAFKQMSIKNKTDHLNQYQEVDPFQRAEGAIPSDEWQIRYNKNTTGYIYDNVWEEDEYEGNLNDAKNSLVKGIVATKLGTKKASTRPTTDDDTTVMRGTSTNGFYRGTKTYFFSLIKETDLSLINGGNLKKGDILSTATLEAYFEWPSNQRRGFVEGSEQNWEVKDTINWT